MFPPYIDIIPTSLAVALLYRKIHKWKFDSPRYPIMLQFSSFRRSTILTIGLAAEKLACILLSGALDKSVLCLFTAQELKNL